MNGKTGDECIFERLERVLYNDKLHEVFPIIDVYNLVRSGSEHALILLQFSRASEQVIKIFRFLKLWLKEESCMEVILKN